MDELKDKYHDLDNLFYNLKITVKECDDVNYRDEIMEIMRRVREDVEELETQVFRQEQEEQRELVSEFERSRL